MRDVPGPEDGFDGDLVDDELPATERARMRRRDHDATAHDRALMNDGSAKWFKQAVDRQARAARDGKPHRRPDDRADPR
jgi:hypothetical protein